MIEFIAKDNSLNTSADVAVFRIIQIVLTTMSVISSLIGMAIFFTLVSLKIIYDCLREYITVHYPTKLRSLSFSQTAKSS